MPFKSAPLKLVIAAVLCSLGFCFINRAQASLPVPRGRPVLNAARTTFVADDGQPLRGPFTSTEWTGPVSAQNIASMKSLGFNAIHLYGESFNLSYPTNGSTAPGYSQANIDAIVAETRTNGLYLILTIGNGAANGNYNRAYETNFWNLYGARYANETHVMFEIQNEPVAWGPSYLTSSSPPGAVDMEVACYKAIRANAPNTPVLLFTYAVFGGKGGADAAMTDIHAFNTNVFGNANAVWTNEAVAFHGYNGWSGTSTAVSYLLGYGYPCMMTEYGTGDWGSTDNGVDAEMTWELERQNVSWLSFLHVPGSGVSSDVSLPQCYSNVVKYSGLGWTPDYGSFPSPRGPYNNGGLARSIPASYTSSFLSGTPLRLQAEDFDTGGEGVAYHELTTTNLGGQYRTNEAVDIETTTDTGGGYDVTSTAAGEWLEYTVMAPYAGYYNLSLRYAAPSNGCVVQIACKGQDQTGSWMLPSTGSSSTWATVTKPVFLKYGHQILHINILNGGFNLNWMELTPVSSGLIPNGTYKFLNAATGLVPTAQTTTNLIVASNYSGSTNQQWTLQHVGGGQYKITSVANGNSWNANNNVLTTSGWGTGDNRSFIITPASGSFYSLLPVGNGVPVETSASNPNTIDENNPYSGGANQQWVLAAPSAPMFPVGLSATAISTTQVSLVWNAVAGATSYNVKRSATSGGSYTTIATGVTATNYTDTVPVGMIYYYVVSAVAGGVESPNSSQAPPNLLYPWQTQDIGAVGVTGSGSLSNGVFTVNGAGADIWGTADALRFVYVPVSGNCTIIARVTSVQNTDPWSKAGVMIRESLNANAANTFIAVTPDNGVTWQYRTSTGGNTGNSATGGFIAPYWVKLVRSGNTFSGYRSPDGVTWTQQGTTQTFTMATTAYVGLALTSHNGSSSCTATFDNVTAPGWANPIPPNAPASLTAIVTNWNVALTWPPSSGATSYNVKRATAFGGPYIAIGNVTTTNYADNTMANNTSYYYVVSALNAAGEGANSVQATVSGQTFAPSGLFGTVISTTRINLTWNTFTNATNYNVKRSITTGGPYTAITNGVTGTNYADTSVSPGSGWYYVVSAMVGGNETPNSAEAVLQFPKLAGAIIGTAGSYNNSGSTIANVFDNNLTTYFDGPATSNGNNCWAGLDFGAGTNNVITQINYCPRSTFESRMVGGLFQGANQSDFSDAVTLYTVGTQPATGVFTSASIANTTAFRYVRYLSPNNGWGNVAEVQFYGYQSIIVAPVPGGLTAAAVSGSQINLVWNTFTNAASYKVKRSLTNGGPYAVVASGVTATNYADGGLNAGTVYYYVVSAMVSGSETSNSVQAAATTLSGSYGSLVHRYSFGEGGGSSVADSIGGPVWNGTLPNGGTLSGGQLTLSASAAQYAGLPAGIVGGLSNFTVVAWVNLNSPTNWSRIFDFGASTTTYLFLTPQNGNTGTLRFGMTTNGGGNEQQINCGSVLTTGVWHQVAVTLNSGTGILYLDGVAAGTNSGLTLNPAMLGGTANNYIGKSQYPDPGLNGLLDEFRIYNAALSPTDIATTYTMGAGVLPSTNVQASVTLGNLNQTYDGTGKAAGCSTVPASLAVALTYNGVAGAPTNAGSYTVVATVTASGYQGGATNALVINKGAGTVTLNNLTQTYDGTAKSTSATTTPSGLTVNITYNGSANAPTNAGSYTVAGIVNDANYQGGTTNVLAINPALLVVAANNQTNVYGGSNVAFSVSYSGFVNGEGLGHSDVTGFPLMICAATANSPVGSYVISNGIGTLASVNYTLVLSNGMLTVVPAGLTITAKNQGKSCGQVLSLGAGQSTFVCSGLVNGDTVTSVTLNSDGAAVGAVVGGYPLVPSAAVGSGMANYNITYLAGTLTVIPAGLKALAYFSGGSTNSGWQAYGDTNLFGWDATNQVLNVTWDTTGPNSYYYHPLGTALTTNDSFLVEFDLTINDTVASGTGLEQMSLGLMHWADATNANFLPGNGYAPNLFTFDYHPPVSGHSYIEEAITSSTVDNWFYDTQFLAPRVVYHVVLSHDFNSMDISGVVYTNGQVMSTFPNPDNLFSPAGSGPFLLDTLSVISYTGDSHGDQILAHGTVANLVSYANYPSLNIAVTNGMMNIVWPAVYSNYTVQSSTNLAGGNWTVETSVVPQMINGQWTVTLPILNNSPGTFYRLVK